MLGLALLKKRAGIRPAILVGAVTIAVGVGWLFTRDGGGTDGPFPFPVEAAVPDAAIDAPGIDAPIDAPPVLDPNAVWVTHTIVSHALCQGADGTNLGDFDNDGDTDVVTACEQGNAIWVARNDGAGSFTTFALPSPLPGTGAVSGPEDARFGDVDGDGLKDIVIAESAGLRVRWFKNNGGVGQAGWNTPITVQNGTYRFMHAAVHSPGVIFTGSYSTGAEVARYTASAPYTTWTRTQMSSANWVKGLEIHGNDLLIWDYLGSLRGVRWIKNATTTPIVENALGCVISGLNCFGEAYTLRGAKVGNMIATAIGTPDGLSPGSTFKIIGGATATFPSDFGRAQAVNLCDVDGDGVLDMMVTASHSNIPADDITEPPSALSSVAWLKGPDFTQRGEASGTLGIKHDNVECMDVDGDGDADLVTTEEKSIGLLWLENPRIP